MQFCRYLVNLSLFAVLIALLIDCCTVDVHFSKPAPEYSGVDPKAAQYVNEYLELAKSNGIRFHHVVTVGFKDIQQDSSSYRTIGLSNFGSYFREIDLDRHSWENSTGMTRMMLLWHELNHSYCGRNHDYGKGKKYGIDKKEPTLENGFYSDHCPISIMYPIIVGDDCALSHYSDYIVEMFQRCTPY